MQKATLLTLALSVSALFASAQSYTADKVYSIKNKATNQKVYYAAAMPQTSNMACSAADKGSADISGWYDGKKRLAHIMHIE